MFVTAVAILSWAWVLASADGSADVDVGLGGPLFIDTFAWYVIGAYFNVLPSLVL
jgi:hypothetical protein